MRLVILALTILSLNAFANGHDFDYLQDKHYTPVFEVQGVQERCPKRAGSVSCLAVGGDIVLKSTLLNCIDSIVFFNAKLVHDHHRRISFVIVYANAKAPSRAHEVRCIRANTIVKTVGFEDRVYRDVRVINHFKNRL